MPGTQHSLATLSFTEGSRGRHKICLWCPTTERDPAACNAEGRRRADELMVWMERQRAPFLLGHVANAIVAIGEYGPLETGFFQRVTEHALSGDLLRVTLSSPQRKPKLELVSSQ